MRPRRDETSPIQVVPELPNSSDSERAVPDQSSASPTTADSPAHDPDDQMEIDDPPGAPISCSPSPTLSQAPPLAMASDQPLMTDRAIPAPTLEGADNLSLFAQTNDGSHDKSKCPEAPN